MSHQKLLRGWLNIFFKRLNRRSADEAQSLKIWWYYAIYAIFCGLFIQSNSSSADALSNLNPTCPPGSWSGPSFILRTDFNNINVLECGEDNSYYQLEQGAQLSASRTFTNNTNGISIDGLGAVVMRYKGLPGPGVQGLMVAPYIQGDGTYQFSNETLPTKGTDTLTYGVFTQFAFLTQNDVFNGFRFRAGDVTGSSGINSTSLVGEWLPAFYTDWGAVGLPQPARVLPLIYEFDFDLMTQYDRLNYGKNSYRLFVNNDDALRGGPLLTLKTQLNAKCEHEDSGCAPELADTFLDKLVASVSLHTSIDVLTSRTYLITTANVTYNANKYVGIFASYSYGNAEATGNLSSQIRGGLALKF